MDWSRSQEWLGLWFPYDSPANNHWQELRGVFGTLGREFPSCCHMWFLCFAKPDPFLSFSILFYPFLSNFDFKKGFEHSTATCSVSSFRCFLNFRSMENSPDPSSPALLESPEGIPTKTPVNWGGITKPQRHGGHRGNLGLHGLIEACFAWVSICFYGVPSAASCGGWSNSFSDSWPSLVGRKTVEFISRSWPCNLEGWNLCKMSNNFPTALLSHAHNESRLFLLACSGEVGWTWLTHLTAKTAQHRSIPPFGEHMGVSVNGGTPKSSIYRWIFPYKPSSYWGNSHNYGNPHNPSALSLVIPSSAMASSSDSWSRRQLRWSLKHSLSCLLELMDIVLGMDSQINMIPSSWGFCTSLLGEKHTLQGLKATNLLQKRNTPCIQGTSNSSNGNQT